jgi:transposase
MRMALASGCGKRDPRPSSIRSRPRGSASIKRPCPKSPLGDAVRYLTNQWQALCRFLEHGSLEIDNNGAERQLRAIAVGHKNWLFASSMADARRAAVIYSLVQSRRLVSIDPFAYFRDVLLRVATHPQSRVAELTPKAWAAQPGATPN